MKSIIVNNTERSKNVAPCAGAWVEMPNNIVIMAGNPLSPPVRGRGLKFQHGAIFPPIHSRPLCGGVG